MTPRLRRRWGLATGTAVICGGLVVLGTPQPASATTTVFTVTTTANAGAGSLRTAIVAANDTSGPVEIAFAIPTSDPGCSSTDGVCTVTPTSPLPALTGGGATIDGSTEKTNTGLTNPTGGPEIEIDGSSAGPGADGLILASSGNTVYGLDIVGFQASAPCTTGCSGGTGIRIRLTADSNVVTGSYIGVAPTGSAAVPNQFAGVDDGSTGNTIGGPTAAKRNIISGNGVLGVILSGGSNTVEGNYMGINATGTAPIGGGAIGVLGSGNMIGGPTAADRNVISGNQGTTCKVAGVRVTGSSNIVEHDYIGTNPTGTAAIPNGCSGTFLTTGGVLITTGAIDNSLVDNLISGNVGLGVGLGGGPSTSLEGNYIGTNAMGTAAIPNTQLGVILGTADTLGGPTAGDRNVISGNGMTGVGLGGSSDTVEGNYIGTNAGGTAAVPNGGNDGVFVRTGNNTIGGPNAGDGNVISGNNGIGVTLNGPSNTVEGNYIGTNATGTAAVPNMHLGVRVGGSHNTVGGPTPADRNVISGNMNGVGLTGTSNIVEGNYIGTNAGGTAAIPNTGAGPGVAVSGADNTIGGPTAADRNVISGNDTAGVYVGGSSNTVQGNYIGTNASGAAAVPNGFGVGVSGADNVIATNVISGNEINALSLGGDSNTVEGNYIGTNAGGTAAVPNREGGAFVGGTGNTIGGPIPSDRNVISGNGGTGVGLGGPSNTVEGNYIGTNANGTAAIPNTAGGMFSDTGNTIGGPTAADRNVISGNYGPGVALNGPSNTVEGNYIGTNATGTAEVPNRFGVGVSGADNAIATNVISGNEINALSLTGDSNTVQGNYIGTNAAGTAAVPNREGGVFVGGTGNTIGGPIPSDRNVISGNGGTGVGLGGPSNTVEGNDIGTNAGGTAAVPNGTGVGIGPTASNNLIADNVISGNEFTGVGLGGPSNTVEGNEIGTNASGAAIPNAGNGVGIDANDNTIGGSSKGAANVVAYNGGGGVLVSSGTGNRISRNSIYTNGALGIALGTPTEVTLPTCCGHTGPNRFENSPVLKSAKITGNGLKVTGSFTMPGTTTVMIEFFASPAPDPSGYGEGETFLGTITFSVKGNGKGKGTHKFKADLPTLSAGTVISATATDANGNTSEFSNDVFAH